MYTLIFFVIFTIIGITVNYYYQKNKHLEAEQVKADIWYSADHWSLEMQGNVVTFSTHVTSLEQFYRISKGMEGLNTREMTPKQFLKTLKDLSIY